MHPVLVGLFLCFSIAYAFFFRWTWRKLWRRGETRGERVVYDTGVRGFGVMMWVALGLLTPLWEAWQDRQPLLSAPTVTAVLLACCIQAPISLWMGYWWGRMMSAVFVPGDPT